MIGSKPIAAMIFIISFSLLFISCKNEGESGPSKTTKFVPAVNDYDFFIEGEIDDKLLHYRQVNYDWTNVSNTYFPEYHESWLQAYTDSLDAEGSWEIRIHDVDIESVDLPYSLSTDEANIQWADSRVDVIIQNTDYCHGVDSNCSFNLNAMRGAITITRVEEQIIEGTFEGRAILIKTGFTSQQDTSLYHDVKNGAFRIKYRID